MTRGRNPAQMTVLLTLPFAVQSEAGGGILAVFEQADHAAAFVSVLGEGAVVTYSSPEGFVPSCVLWTEGPEGDGDAGESYDVAAQKMNSRLEDFISRYGRRG